MTAAPGACLAAVSVVAALRPDPGNGVTAIDKQPVTGPVRVGRFGARGDVQVDRKHHGGPDKALYAVDSAEIEHWRGELGRDLPPGVFGENLRITGLAVDDAEIGERWQVGDVVLEVTGPRTPCATFARWLGEDRWVRRYTERGRPGAYLRVVRAGTLAAGDPVTVLHRPGHGVTVAELLAGPTPERARLLLAAGERGLDLAEYVLGPLRAAASRGA